MTSIEICRSINSIEFQIIYLQIVELCCSVINVADCLDGATVEQKSLAGRRFAGINVSNDSNVSNLMHALVHVISTSAHGDTVLCYLPDLAT
jgi:hypothetical protein